MSLLAAKQLCKSFGQVEVLKDIDIELKAGRVHALCGENGAGKSTIIKLLTGVYSDYTGEMLVNGKPVVYRSIKDAISLGITVVHQEFSVFDNLTVEENILLEAEPSLFGFVNRKQMRAKCQEILQRLGIDLDVRLPLSALSTAQHQLVEIAKALRYKAQVLILDEPTASLSHTEIEHLFKLIVNLKQQNLAILYVSHRLDEIFAIADDLTIIKDGQISSRGLIGEYDHDKIIAKMVGRSLKDIFPDKSKRKHESKQAILEVKNLKYKPNQKGINFKVFSNQIVGLAGLIGSGRTEFAQTIYGIRQSVAGQVYINGKVYDNRTAKKSLDQALVMLTESRKVDGLFLQHSVARNFTASSLTKKHHYLALYSGISELRASSGLECLNVKLANLDQAIVHLSGGNQQKVLLGRILENNPQLLILDEPTRGVDIGAKVQIYHILRDLADQGCAILIISSELIEIVGLCDEVHVMKEGAITATLNGDDINEDEIIKYAVSDQYD